MYIYTHKEIYYKILAHAIMKAKRSQDLLSASRKVGSVIQRSEGQTADSVNFGSVLKS